ncbi:Fc.00g092610.m01.CDS01 [Cosmosporella sp. VM-42]
MDRINKYLCNDQYQFPMDANIIGKLIEEGSACQDTIVGLVGVWALQQARRRLEQSSEEDEEDEDEEEDEYTEYTEEDEEEEGVTPLPSSAPEPQRDILSRKRPRSPSRDLAPCLGPSREAPTQMNKRQRIELPTSLNTPKVQPDSSIDLVKKLADMLRQDATEEEKKLLQTLMDGFQQSLLQLAQKRHEQLYPNGFPFMYAEALEDAKLFMGGRLTAVEVEQFGMNLQKDPRFPMAYLAATDSVKRTLLGSVLGRPQSQRKDRETHESVLQAKHIKEIDARPRGNSRDRIKLWLAEVTVP